MCLVTQRDKLLPQKLAVVQLVFKFIPTPTEAPLAGTEPPSLPHTGHRNASQSDCSTEITVQNKAAVSTRVARVERNALWPPVVQAVVCRQPTAEPSGKMGLTSGSKHRS
jgi:hypothetical protein